MSRRFTRWRELVKLLIRFAVLEYLACVLDVSIGKQVWVTKRKRTARHKSLAAAIDRADIHQWIAVRRSVGGSRLALVFLPRQGIALLPLSIV
jgi:hypothetical protein